MVAVGGPGVSVVEKFVRAEAGRWVGVFKRDFLLQFLKSKASFANRLWLSTSSLDPVEMKALLEIED